MAQFRLEIVSFLVLGMIYNVDLAPLPNNDFNNIKAVDGITCPLLHYHGVKMVDPETKNEITEPSKIGRKVLLECIEDTSSSYQQLNFYSVYPESTTICQQDGTWSLETEPVCIDVHQQFITFNTVPMRSSKYCSYSSCDHMLKNAKNVGESVNSNYLLTNLSSVTNTSHEFQLVLFIPQRRTCLSFMNYNVPLDSNGNPKPHLAQVFVNEEDALPKSNAYTRLYRQHYVTYNKSRKLLNPPQAAVVNIGACVDSFLVLFVTPIKDEEIDVKLKKNFFTWKPAPEFIGTLELYEHAKCTKEPTIAHASLNCITPEQVCTIKCQPGYKMIIFGDNYTASSIDDTGHYTIQCKHGRWVPDKIKQPMPACIADKMAIEDSSTDESPVIPPHSDRSLRTRQRAEEGEVTLKPFDTLTKDNNVIHGVPEETSSSSITVAISVSIFAALLLLTVLAFCVYYRKYRFRQCEYSAGSLSGSSDAIARHPKGSESEHPLARAQTVR